MEINKTLSLSGQVILNINNTSVQVVFLGATVDLNRQMVSTSKQIMNKELVDNNIEEVQKQIDEFNQAVKTQAVANGTNII